MFRGISSVFLITTCTNIGRIFDRHCTLGASPDLPSAAVRTVLISLQVVQFGRLPLSHISTPGFWLSVMVPTFRHMIAGSHRLWVLTWCLNPVKFLFIISSPPSSVSILRHNKLLRRKVIGFIQSVALATEPGWLADRCSVSQQLGALQTHSFSFLTQRTYSCLNFVAISSLVLELLKKCRVR